MFTKSKNLLLALFVLLTVGGLFFATNQSHAKALGLACGPTDNTANWKSSAVINCVSKDWYFDVWSTARYNMQTPPATVLIFRSPDGGDGDALVVTKKNADDEEVNSFCLISESTIDSGGALQGSSGIGDSNCGDLADTDKADDPAPAGVCSIINYEDCTPSSSIADGNKDPFNKAAWEAKYPNAPWIDKWLGWVTGSVAAATAQENKDEACQRAAGTLGFLLCPLFNSISASINNILGFKVAGEDGCAPADGTYCIDPESPLQTLLIVRPLQFSSGDTLRSANNIVVNIANSIYVLVFLIVIFLNFIDFGIDNYTIKRLLPRLVAAIIFTQFSYLICAFAIDMGNSLGYAVPNILTLGGAIINQEPIKIALFAVAGIGSGSTGISILAGIGGFLLALLIMIGVLVALILALIYMVFRLFALYLLVLVAPLAIAASVLPLTNKYFRMWGTNLIKLNLMFPLVTGLLAVSGIISGILIAEGCRGNSNNATCSYLATIGLRIPPGASSSPGGGSDLLILAGALIPVLALFLIPKCLKLSGELMAFTAGAVSAKLAGGARERGSEAVEKSRQEGQLAKLGGKYNTAVGKQFSHVPGLRRAGAKRIAEGGRQKKAHEDVIKNKIEAMDGDTLRTLIETTKGKGKIGEAAKKEGVKRYTESEEQQSNRVRHNLPELPHLNSNMEKLSKVLNKTAKSGERTYAGALNVDQVNPEYRSRYGADDNKDYTVDVTVNVDPKYLTRNPARYNATGNTPGRHRAEV